MSPQMTSLMEEIEKNYQFYIYVFSLFVVCMGISRWFGRHTWVQREKSRRKTAGLPVASLMSQDGSAEQSWTFPGLFLGGLLGVVMVASYMTYVAVMVIQLGPQEILRSVGAFMSLPITAIAFAIFGYISNTRLLGFLGTSRLAKAGMSIVLLICINVAGGLATARLEPLHSLALYTLVMAMLSLGLSYAIGMSEGVRTADPALNYPLVTLETRDGKLLDRAWLYERTDSDYRLVTESGANHIVPAANVKEITGPLGAPGASNSSG